MTGSSPSKTRASVCVLAAHPMVLAHVQRILNCSNTQLESARLSLVCEDGAPAIPDASLYVLDAASCPSGISQQVRQLLALNSKANILVLGDSFEENDALELLNLGVKGLVTHAAMEQQLPRALQTVSAGGLWVWRRLLSRFVDTLLGAVRQQDTVLPNDVRLSQRERQIASALCKNLTNKEIANELNISERTVKFHVSNLLSKFKVQRRSELVLRWYGQEGSGLSPRFLN